MSDRASKFQDDLPPVKARADRSGTVTFTQAIPAFSGFHGIVDPTAFTPLPEDWVIGLADVVSSTDAIASGRYKSVNTAGAAVISAVSNALGALDFPFIFAGDGASFAVGPEDAERAGRALAATVRWVGEELDLTLRGAMVPMADIRAQNLDVRIARFAVSPGATYAMFSGGGLAWAEERLKAGALSLPEAPAGAVPDLTGLSCRFQDLQSKHGIILSILVRPAVESDDPRFRALVSEVLGIAETGPEAGRPVPVFRPMGGIRLRSVAIDGKLQRRPGQSRLASTVKAAAAAGFAAVVLALGLDMGGFSAKRYLREVVENSDFRKYDDGLMMTLDCDPLAADRIERRLQAAAADGTAHYGLHRQDKALITCVVPSVTASNHVHFIDGASGGYAMASRDLKSRLASGNVL